MQISYHATVDPLSPVHTTVFICPPQTGIQSSIMCVVLSVCCLYTHQKHKTTSRPPEHDLWPLFLSTDMRLLPTLSANTECVCAHIGSGVPKASVLITLRWYKVYRLQQWTHAVCKVKLCWVCVTVFTCEGIAVPHTLAPTNHRTLSTGNL